MAANHLNNLVNAELARKYAETSAGIHEEELATDADTRNWGDVKTLGKSPRQDSKSAQYQSLFGGKNPE